MYNVKCHTNSRPGRWLQNWHVNDIYKSSFTQFHTLGKKQKIHFNSWKWWHNVWFEFILLNISVKILIKGLLTLKAKPFKFSSTENPKENCNCTLKIKKSAQKLATRRFLSTFLANSLRLGNQLLAWARISAPLITMCVVRPLTLFYLFSLLLGHIILA